MVEYRLSISETNAIKGMAIVAMLLHHLFYKHPEYGLFVHQIGLIGKVCVAMFLFLSGYGLTVQFYKVLNGSSLNKNRGGQTLRFLYKRFVKFYINYWVVFIVSVPIGVYVFGRGLEIPYGDGSNIPLMLFKDFMGINGMQSYNITWWFNKLIIKLYFLFPLYFALIQSRNWYIKLLVMFFTLYDPQTLAFVFGILYATEIELINKCFNQANCKYVLAFSLLLFVVFCISRQLSPIPYTNGLYADIFITISFVLMIVSIARLRNKEYKVLSLLGKHSMNMYMVHTFIFAYFYKDFIYGFKYPIVIFLALLFSSFFVSYIIEILKKVVCLHKIQEKLLGLAYIKII